MICPKCGNKIDENMRYCGVCGADTQGTEPRSAEQPQQTQQNGYYDYNQQYNRNYNQSYNANYNQYGYNQGFPRPDDKPDTLMNVLSFFFPIVGIILYFIERETKPARSKAALKWSLISIGVSVVFCVLMFAVSFAAMFFFAADSTMYYY